MRYSKPHLTIQQQVNLLLNRGLIGDPVKIADCLESAGYYRLSAYWHPFRRQGASGTLLEDLYQGTTLEQIWSLYRFDRKLRFCLLDAIERIEVALRAQLAYYHTQNNSPFHYATPSYFQKWTNYTIELTRLHERAQKSKNTIDYVAHFFQKYGSSHTALPLWMAMGIFDFGFLVRFYQHSDYSIKKAIATKWETPEKALSSWLKILQCLRNDCAHHARLWNRCFTAIPLIPRLRPNPFWHYIYSDKANKWVNSHGSNAKFSPFSQKANTIFPLIFICSHLLKTIAPSSDWHNRIEKLITQFELAGFPASGLGLPAHWKQHPLWK